MIHKRMIMRLVFVAEIVLFGWFYYFGVGGMNEIQQLRHESDGIEQNIRIVQQHIMVKESELSAWISDPFYKEKLAREQLHMAKDGEEIYLYDAA